MTIPVLPSLDRNSPTFRDDVDTFFGTQLPAFSAAINPEIERINQIGAGSFTATSGDTLTISLGTVSLAIEAGKGFSPGQPVMIARTAAPGDYMAGQVVSYDAGTGAMQVDVTLINGTGAHTGWSVSIVSIVSPLELDSIVVLTSGTSWTCPEGVRKVRARISGPGGAGTFNAYSAAGGGGGGVWECIASVTPGAAYTYAIGATAGASTTMTIGGATHTAYSGGNASGVDGGVGGSATGSFGVAMQGTNGSTSQYNGGIGRGGCSVIGYGRGGDGTTNSNGGTPTAGAIILELYK